MELTDDEEDYINDLLAVGAFGGATGALIIPEIVPYLIGTTMHTTAPYFGRAAMAGMPFVLGYMIGAYTGTKVAGDIWGEEGERVALGFYSGGMLPGTEKPDLTDFQYIFKPTKPGGPTSLYDIAEGMGRAISPILSPIFSGLPRPIFANPTPGPIWTP